MDMFSFLLGRNSGGGKGALKIQVVQELPETGEENILYLVPRQVTKNRNVFDEYIWVNSAWELIGTTDIDISGKQDVFQYSTMPAASASNLGKIYQYTGTTNANYTNGYFYVCVSDGGNPATYSWANISVQDSGSSDYDIRTIIVRNTPTAEDLAEASKLINDLYAIYQSDEAITDKLLVNVVTIPANEYNGNIFITKFPTKYLIKDKRTAYEFKTQPSLYPLTASSSNINLITTFKIIGTWSNNVFTATGLQVVMDGSYSGSVLTTSNYTAYTPSADYNPATKKYVDDAISLVGGFPQTVYLLTLEEEGTRIAFETQAFTTLLNQIGTKSSNEYCVLVRSKKAGTNYYNVALASFDRNLSTTNQAILQFLDLPSAGQHNSINKYAYKVQYTYSNGEYTNVSVSQREKITILTSDNTDAYTPSNDYNPATKKYVDDSIASAITDALGGNY